jgi:hypothetical protein
MELTEEENAKINAALSDLKKLCDIQLQNEQQRSTALSNDFLKMVCEKYGLLGFVEFLQDFGQPETWGKDCTGGVSCVAPCISVCVGWSGQA